MGQEFTPVYAPLGAVAVFLLGEPAGSVSVNIRQATLAGGIVGSGQAELHLPRGSGWQVIPLDARATLVPGATYVLELSSEVAVHWLAESGLPGYRDCYVLQYEGGRAFAGGAEHEPDFLFATFGPAS